MGGPHRSSSVITRSARCRGAESTPHPSACDSARRSARRGAGRGTGHSFHGSDSLSDRTWRNVPLTCKFAEPPIGIEPMTYALRGTRDLAAHALTAPMAPVVALMTLAALRLSGNPVHKPVHEQEAVARPSDRLNAPGPRGAGAFKRLRIRGRQVYSSALGWPCG
jgi:hypothetical protein